MLHIKYLANFGKKGSAEGATKNAMRQAIYNIALLVQRNIRLNIQPGWGAGINSRLNYFTGGLLRSWGAPIVMTENKATIGSTRPKQALLQEYGGDIKPVHARALFIPLTIAAAKVGAQKDPAMQKATGLVFGRDFAFAQRVSIRPKGYIGRGLKKAHDGAPTIIGAAMKGAVREALK